MRCPTYVIRWDYKFRPDWIANALMALPRGLRLLDLTSEGRRRAAPHSPVGKAATDPACGYLAGSLPILLSTIDACLYTTRTASLGQDGKPIMIAELSATGSTNED